MANSIDSNTLKIGLDKNVSVIVTFPNDLFDNYSEFLKFLAQEIQKKQSFLEVIA